MKTLIPNSKKITRKWFVVDASELPVGRLATKVADILRGKNKAIFTPSQDTGDYVIVINADKVKLTGKKWTDKIYYHHTGFMGGIKSKTAKKLHEDKPTAIVDKAISGMVPRNRLKKEVLSKLFIYTGTEHPHEAQQPEILSFSK